MNSDGFFMVQPVAKRIKNGFKQFRRDPGPVQTTFQKVEPVATLIVHFYKLFFS